MGQRTRLALAAGVLVSMVALGGCSAIQGLLGGGESVTRDSETQEVTEAGNADVFSLRVGDCFDDSAFEETEISEVAAVPCTEPHDNEIYFEFSMADGEWPGDDAINAEAETQCGAQFDTFVGLAYAESVLEWFPITPTQGSWEEGNDRIVQCAIYEGTSKVQGSLAGVAR